MFSDMHNVIVLDTGGGVQQVSQFYSHQDSSTDVEQLGVIWGLRLNLDIQYLGQQCDRRSEQEYRKIECVITFQPLQNRAGNFSPKWMMH